MSGRSHVDATGRAGVWVIVVAAGSGRRFGAAKQFMALGGRRVIDHAVDRARRHAEGVVVVVPAGSGSADIEASFASMGAGLVVTAGGSSRSESVRRGLARVAPTAAVVLVHDGARPLASAAVYEAVIAAVRSGADAAVPALEPADSIRHRTGGPIERSELVAVQTPQAFRADLLRAAHATGADATDDAALVEAVGGTVVLVPGDPSNLKITRPLDLEIAEMVLARSTGAHP